MLTFGPAETFQEKAESYASIGLYLAEVSNLDFEIDQFIAEVARKHPELSRSRSKRFPKKWRHKIAFCVEIIEVIPDLRRIPIYSDGYLSMDYLSYAVDEIFYVRNLVAHGSIDVVRNHLGVKSWTASKATFVRDADNAECYSVSRYRFSEHYLEELFHRSVALRKYFFALRRFLEAGENWESRYQEDKQIRENRKFIIEILGGNAPDWLFVEGDLTARMTFQEKVSGN
ncbi:hypothetical protein [Thalassococcus profundi]|uniref:hypothetical protein n=1 Tax=Thalassococcus profundi TaxID=2282382 RepID=UPI001314592D|nr:hypothetical protein [Thalassococcus profundi]